MTDYSQIDHMSVEQLKEAYRLHNLELSSGFKILNELESEGKISVEKCDLMKQRFYKMHKIMSDNQAKETQLQQKTKKIALELSSEVLKLEKAQQQQKEHDYKLKALEEKLDLAKKDTAQVDENNQMHQSEISKLENMKVERENEYAQAEQRKKDELNPLIEDCAKDIQQVKLELQRGVEDMQDSELKNKDLELRIALQEQKLQALAEEYQVQKENYFKDKDEPVRLGKGNDNIRKGVAHLQNELESLRLKKEHYKTLVQKEEQSLTQLEEQVTLKKQEVNEKQRLIRELDQSSADEVRLNQQLRQECETLNREIEHFNQEMQNLQKMKSQANDETKKCKVKIDKEHKEYKSEEHQNKAILDLNKELVQKVQGAEKLIEELKKDAEKYKKQIADLMEEQQLFIGKLVTKGLEDKTIQQEIHKLTAERTASEDTIKKYQHEVSIWNEELKFLSTIREKMARTASQASA